jgi:hypothetical protein
MLTPRYGEGTLPSLLAFTRTLWFRATTVALFPLIVSGAMAVSGRQVFQNLATLPGMGGLLGALFFIFRDWRAHDRALLIQDAGHRFEIGATSHMANTAFDKHVKFCEEYDKAMQETIDHLFDSDSMDSVADSGNRS